MSTIERKSEPSADPGEILSGLTWIGVGVAAWLFQAGRVDGIDLATYWPIALVLWGVSEFIAQPRRSGSGGGFLVAIGAFLLINNLGYASWPLVLVALGAMLVWRGWRDDAKLDQAMNRNEEVGHDG